MVMPGQGTTKDENGACQKPTRSGIQVGISAKAGTMTGCRLPDRGPGAGFVGMTVTRDDGNDEYKAIKL